MEDNLYSSCLCGVTSGKVQGREIVASSAETSSSGAKSFREELPMLNTKASSPPHCRRGISRCASPGLRKQKLLIIANLTEKCELYSSLQNIVHFAANLLAKYGEKHRISRIFDSICTTLRKGEFTLPSVWKNLPPLEGSANTEEFCEIFRKFKLFVKISQGFRKVFFRGSIAKHIDFCSYSHVFSVFQAHGTE